MTIEELKEKKLDNIESVIEYYSHNRNGLSFLPANLAELIAEIAKSNSPQSCINLNSNIGEILSKCNGIENKIGIEINTESVEIAKYLNPNLEFDNSNPLFLNINKKFDVVICFPPLGKRIEINERKVQSEKLYVSKSLQLLNDKGKAILILPHNFLTAPVYAKTREHILNNYGINQIISLPPRTLRNTGVELSILVVSHNKIEATKYYKIEDRNFSQITLEDSDFSVQKDNLSERWDYNFHNPKNREYEKELKNQETKRIDELVEVILGTHFSREEIKEKGDYLWLTSRNVSNGNLYFTDGDKFIVNRKFNPREQNAILRNGDILIPRIQRNKESFYVHTDNDKKIIAFQHFIILRGKNAEYVATYLNTENGINLFNQQIKRHVIGNVIPTISLKDLRNIQIPILPIEDLELASRRKLEKLSYEELLNIKEKYISLKSEFNIT